MILYSRLVGLIIQNCLTGVPLQFTTDKKSETVQLSGLINALRCASIIFCWLAYIDQYVRELSGPEYDDKERPAQVYLQSVHKISIERSWLHLQLDFDDNAIHAFQRGRTEANYDDQDPVQ